MATGDSHGKAHARVGLMGNPSDGYGGRVIAMTIPDFGAEVQFTPGSQWTFASHAGSKLLAATVRALETRRPELLTQPGRLLFETTIPRQVGLSGSSAIIIALLRSLAAYHGVSWDPIDLARVALEVETEELGWAAGPQDRVVQAMEGLVDMDFAQPWRPEGYERLDTARLPPLFLAWDQSTGTPSDVAHSTVRERWLAEDTEVVWVMNRFATLATEARASLDDNTAADVWPDLMCESIALRRQIWKITPGDNALVETGTSLGAGVAFAGSGGAVVGAAGDFADLERLGARYEALGAGFLVLSFRASR